MRRTKTNAELLPACQSSEVSGKLASGTNGPVEDELMTDTKGSCESCGMAIATGPYCEYCVDATGKLQDFETRLERMVAWTLRSDPGLACGEAEKQTIAYMAGMPAWRDHPSVITKLGRSSA
jgi:hypothetical protein